MTRTAKDGAVCLKSIYRQSSWEAAFFSMKSTKQHKKYWEERKIDWEQAYWNPEHPHRDLIIEALSDMAFNSVLEVGCGAGANLYRVLQAWPRTELGGVDINNDAILMARKKLPTAQYLACAPADRIFLGDNSIDVTITDACLIYYDAFKIKKVLKEIYRITRRDIVLCELHSKSIYDKLTSRYHLHNYPKLLTKVGFYDVQMEKITNWPGKPWEKWGYIITAKK